MKPKGSIKKDNTLLSVPYYHIASIYINGYLFSMHVIFISACQKRAIRRSRAILDSYALRAGERCWMSPMTTEGLQEVRAALARSATRQTSVACYQNDGRRRMKLLWIANGRRSYR